MSVPANIKIYHILHCDKLASVLKSSRLLSDAIITRRNSIGTMIGMSKIKLRRLEELTLRSHPGLYVGQCVPFYFCPRSIMLFILHKGNHPEMDYSGGQEPIIHLVADLHRAVDWANQNRKRWAFTTGNAGSYIFEDYGDLSQLEKIDWNSVKEMYWSRCREEKQAEFLMEDCFPWELIEKIGVISPEYDRIVNRILKEAAHKPKVAVRRDWYY